MMACSASQQAQKQEPLGPEIESPKALDADYIYRNDALPESFVAFYKDSSQAGLYKKRRLMARVQYPDSALTLKRLLALKQQTETHLTASDLLLLERAIPRWDSARMFIGFEMKENGLGYKVQRKGEGPHPQQGKKVKVHYKGYLPGGKVFDSSYKRGQPIEFKLGEGRVIQGWEKGIPIFREGGKGTLLIPPELGYGSRGAPPSIPPNSHLFFDIEVIEVGG
jgi:FKBP-type peptidyl-prolyl cis-trans isomerase